MCPDNIETEGFPRIFIIKWAKSPKQRLYSCKRAKLLNWSGRIYKDNLELAFTRKEIALKNFNKIVEWKFYYEKQEPVKYWSKHKITGRKWMATRSQSNNEINFQILQKKF